MVPVHPLAHITVSGGNVVQYVEAVAEYIESKSRGYCIPLNLTKYVAAKTDDKLREVIRRASFNVSDGLPIVWLSRRAGHRDVSRVTGIDLAERLLEVAAERQWRVFLLGAKPEILRRSVAAIRHRHKSLKVVGAQDGYFQTRDIPRIIEEINRSTPQLLFLGLGMPQKEYFVADHLENLNINFCLPVGGAFDIWAGVKRRTPVFVQKIGLEWFYRSFYDSSKTMNILRFGMAFAKDLIRIPKR